MGNLVCDGATCQCSFGTTPATFTASSQDVSGTQAAAGTVSDFETSNLPSFGMCTSLSNPQVAAATSAAMGTLTPQPCQPLLSDWTPGATEVMIDGQAALDDSSTSTCSWGGTITIGSAGQTSVTVT